MKSSFRIFLLIVISILVLSSCEKRKTLVELGNEQQILYLGNGDEPADVDIHTTTGLTEYNLEMAIYEGLVAKDPKTLEVIPAVADSWSISEDNLRYQFHIRENAKWSNGDALTANDFVESWHRGLLPALGNQYASSLFVIKNAEAFYEGKITQFADVGVKAIDDHTLEVELENPTPYFLQLLDHHSMFPVHIKTIQRFGALDERGTRWTRAENFVGNGPFIIKEWTPSKVFSVMKNKYYWDADKVRLQGINFYPINQGPVEERMFRAGQLHKTLSVPSAKIAIYKEKFPELLRSSAYFGTYFYRFNVKVKPFDDVRVRKALAYSIDREAITEKITKGGQIPAFNLTPPNTLGFTATAKMKYDIDEAKKLLAEAGYPNGEGFPVVELTYNTSEDHQKIAVAVQQMWKQSLNIDVKIHNQDWKVFLSSMRTLDFQLARSSWVGDYLDPNTFLDMFVTDGGNNETGWSNKRYDELIRLASQAKNRDERYRYFQEAEFILTSEVPIIPFYTYTKNNLQATSLKGIYENIMDYHPYKYMYLDAAKN